MATAATKTKPGATRPTQAKGRTVAAGTKRPMTKAVAKRGTTKAVAKSSAMGLKTKPKTRGAGS